MSFFSNAKDRLIETMALPLLNRSFFAPYGQAREFRLDSTGKSAEIVMDLNGDPEPLRVRVGGYEFSEESGDTYVTIRAIDTSREWMTALAERYVVGHPVKLPREFSGVLSRIV